MRRSSTSRGDAAAPAALRTSSAQARRRRLSPSPITRAGLRSQPTFAGSRPRRRQDICTWSPPELIFAVLLAILESPGLETRPEDIVGRVNELLDGVKPPPRCETWILTEGRWGGNDPGI